MDLGKIRARLNHIVGMKRQSQIFIFSSDRLIRVWKATEILDEQLSQMNHNRR